MWISEKSSERESESIGGGAVGIVTIGGAKPSVLAEGELRNADLIYSGAVRLPKTGDEVLLIRSPDGENVIVGKINGTPPEGIENGEVYITTGNGSIIRLKNNGEIELSGTVIIRGTTMIDGNLFINGSPYQPQPESGE